jgi:hypothetical protein
MDRTASRTVFILLEAVPVPAFTDLGGIANDGDNRHAAATGGTGPDIDFIYLGKQTGPSAAPLPPANLAILGLVCRKSVKKE